MKRIYKLLFASSFAFSFSLICNAQIGEPFIHDPSTIQESDGKYFTFGTGGGGLISDDGWSWHSGGVRPGGGAAPDAIKIGDRYLIAYGATGGGLGGGHRGIIYTMWNKTLDPKSPDFKYSDPVMVAWSDNDEDCDAIDPGLMLDPNTGRLWMSYGTYYGFIRLVELDPKTGRRVQGNKAQDIAIDCEASDLMYNDGWYYLLGTHGTCCDGVNSTYNIVVGRSRQVTGPYLDNCGRDMLKGGGKMLIAAGDRKTGPGHFGRMIIDKGVEKMSYHYEADYDRSGYSVLDIRPLLWHNGWPVAGTKLKAGKYWIESERRGYALELAVDFVRQEVQGNRWFMRDNKEPLKTLPLQTLDEVKGGWPTGNIGVRIGDYMFRPHQKWQIEAVPEAGGYLDAPYFKIIIEGTNRALAANEKCEVETVPEYTGAPEQLWRIEQLTDGNYRIMPKQVPGTTKQLVLTAIADSTPSLCEYNPDSDDCKWQLKKD